MLDFIPNTLSLGITILFPTYASYKALSTHDPALLTPWLTYFLTFTLISACESLFSFIVCYLPFYAWIRLVLHVYLVLPGEHQGAAWVYSTYIRPFLVEHDAWIERFISTGHDRVKAVGLDYFKRALNYIRALLLGEAGQLQAASSPASPAQSKASVPSSPPSSHQAQSYTQSLLARFSMPSARPVPSTSITPPPQSSISTQNDIYALLTSVLQAASSASLTGNPSPTTPPPPPTASPSYNPSIILPLLSTPQEKLTYITTQTARLRALLGAFDTQAAALTRDTAADMKKSASVGEFEEIRHGDVTPPASSSSPSSSAGRSSQDTKKGWAGWGWGSGGKRVATTPVSATQADAGGK